MTKEKEVKEKSEKPSYDMDENDHAFVEKLNQAVFNYEEVLNEEQK